jgi:hypothetical protein
MQIYAESVFDVTQAGYNSFVRGTLNGYLVDLPSIRPRDGSLERPWPHAGVFLQRSTLASFLTADLTPPFRALRDTLALPWAVLVPVDRSRGVHW